MQFYGYGKNNYNKAGKKNEKAFAFFVSLTSAARFWEKILRKKEKFQGSGANFGVCVKFNEVEESVERGHDEFQGDLYLNGLW